MSTRTPEGPPPTIPITLEEAAKTLTADLIKYAGTEGWQCVGYSDEPDNPHLILYTRTRTRANQLLAFIGYRHNGFKVIGRAIGRVTLCVRP